MTHLRVMYDLPISYPVYFLYRDSHPNAEPIMKNKPMPRRKKGSGAKAGRVNERAFPFFSIYMIFGMLTNPRRSYAQSIVNPAKHCIIL